MNKHLVILASLICAASSSTVMAEHAKPVLEIRHLSDVAAPTSTTLLWSAGGYTVYSYNADGSSAGVIRTGLNNPDMAIARKALQAAPFDITYSRIMCFAYSPSYTEYYVRGKLMYTERMCSGATADETTQQSLATITKLLTPTTR